MKTPEEEIAKVAAAYFIEHHPDTILYSAELEAVIVKAINTFKAYTPGKHSREYYAMLGQKGGLASAKNRGHEGMQAAGQKGGLAKAANRKKMMPSCVGCTVPNVSIRCVRCDSWFCAACLMKHNDCPGAVTGSVK